MSSALVISAMLFAASAQASNEPAPGRAESWNFQLEVRALPGSAITVRDVHSGRALLLDQEPGGELALPREDARVRDLERWERILKWSTGGALVVTATLGTLAAINQPTAFGDGRCQTGHPIFGTYGCDRGLSTLHGVSGVASAILYTANGAIAFSLPGPVGNVSDRERPWHTALSYVHLVGIIVQPLLGLTAAYPQVIGLSKTGPSDPFPRNARTAHLALGYLTTAAFLTTIALEL